MAEMEVIASTHLVRPESLHFDYLSNGSTINAIGNYATTERFKITCEPGSRQLHIYRMIIYIEDVGAFKSAKYGVDIDLTEGIHVKAHAADDSVLADLTAATPVKTNAQWGSLCYDVRLNTYGTGNNGALTVRWTFNNAGAPVSLSEGEYLAVDLKDDFTGLVTHNFMAQGHYE